jgi:GT2 family glycosyltransferase
VNSEAAPGVSVILVNLNGGKYLARCLEALASQTFTGFEIIVIDNGSSDGSVDNLEADWPGIRLVRLKQNEGFSAANNIGAQLAAGRWLAFLNSDAFAAPDWLGNLVKVAEANHLYQFFASRILLARDNTLIDANGDVYHVSGNAWHRDHNQPASLSHLEPDEIFSACAAAALYSREAFLQVGGFDKDFFSYHEDVDLGFRLRLQGYRCLFVPEAIVEHVGAITFGVESNFTIYHVHRNLVWCYWANMPGNYVWRYFPAYLAGNLIFFIYYLLRGQGKAILKARWDALLGMGMALKKRRVVQAARKVTPVQVVCHMDRGWLSPYLLGRRSEKIQQIAHRLAVKRYRG